MSIINNVLKDIEARSSQFVPIQIAAVESAVNEKPQFSQKRLFSLLAILVVAAAGYFYFLYEQKAGQALPPAVASTPAIPEPVPLVSEVVEPDIPANQIIGLQINESSTDMSLEFALQSKVVSYLKERSVNRFVYFLKDTGSEIAAPVISNNQWIEQLSITAEGQGVEVSFRTAEGVLVETQQLSKNDGHIWTIKLKYPPPQAEKTAPVKKAVAAPKEPLSAPVEPTASSSAEDQVKPEVVDEVAEPIVQSQPVKVEIKSTSPALTDAEKLNKAIALQGSRRWQQAENLYVSLFDGSEDLAARQNLLQLYEQRQQNGKFSRLLQESMDRYPDQPEFNTAFARSLYLSGDYQVTITYLQDKAGQNPEQLALIAASYQRLDQHVKAVEYYRLSIDQDGQNARSWIGLGISLEHTGQLKDALQAYRIASRLGNINSRLKLFITERSDYLKKAIN